MKDLILIGNGGHAKDILQIVRDINRRNHVWNLIGFLDDGTAPALGPVADIVMYPNAYYCICINDSQVRADIDWVIIDLNWEQKAADLIHPTAYIGDECSWGEGLVMGPYSVMTNKVELGRHVHMNSHSSVNQNSYVGSYGTLSPGARVCGDCVISNNVSMGANSVVINVKTVGENVRIGAGAVVVDNINEGTTVVGVPARDIRERKWE